MYYWEKQGKIITLITHGGEFVQVAQCCGMTQKWGILLVCVAQIGLIILHLPEVTFPNN